MKGMNKKKNIKLPLTNTERAALRRHRIKISDIPDYHLEELKDILGVPLDRAKELFAWSDFQRIPSIGIRFAEDLVFLGFSSIKELKGQDGAMLTDTFEQKKGCPTDPCVEDQFRLAVYVAETNDFSKSWWDFTAERKQYRTTVGYPVDRPQKL